MKSIFSEKQASPQDNDLRKALGKSFNLWQTLEDYVYSKYPTAMMEWSFSKSGGWSFRMKDNKRMRKEIYTHAGRNYELRIEDRPLPIKNYG